uniref:Uncharacterized protein n=1 Tax=Ditylenchus dipsaci TaxID=166011 RepID=A0A915E2H1_9BILA
MAMFMNFGPRTKVYQALRNPPEQLDDVDFFKRYRMDKDTVQFITDTICVEIQHESNRGRAVSAEMQVLATLDYMRSPGFQGQAAATLGLCQYLFSSRLLQRLFERFENDEEMTDDQPQHKRYAVERINTGSNIRNSISSVKKISQTYIAIITSSIGLEWMLVIEF